MSKVPHPNTDSKTKSPQTVLGIPGKWSSPEAVFAAVGENNLNEFMFAGKILVNLKTQDTFEVAIQERDDRMKESFRKAIEFDEYHYAPDEFLEEIEAHTCLVYVIGNTGSFERARAMAEAGNAILKAGGIGIKVESSGIAFQKGEWQNVLRNLQEEKLYEDVNLYHLFVNPAIRNGRAATYSCGMHTLGFKDTIVYGMEPEGAAELVNEFNNFLIIEQPPLTAGFIFELELENSEMSEFEVTEETDQPNAGDALFENPFGMWKLTPEE
jgi:hypothetical protein